LPALHPGRPLFYFLDAYLILRLTHASILLPMALHVSVRFPRATDTSTKQILAAGTFFLPACFLRFYSAK
jgi:hypothetical protein